jgi:hypothetical protein
LPITCTVSVETPAHREIATLGAINDQCRQHVAAICPGINRNSIGTLVNFIYDRMTVDDHKVVMTFVAEKGLSDPPQILGRLIMQRHARTDASVNEDIVAKAKAVAETFDEFDVVSRNLGAQCQSCGCPSMLLSRAGSRP